MTTLSMTLVRREDGSIDIDGTVDACRKAVEEYVSSTETLTADIIDAVNAAFDAQKGNLNTMPFIVNETLKRMSYNPSDFARVTAAVGDYIRNNSGSRESGALFHIGRGRGSGTFRWSDVPVTPEKK